ncbi:hypothetical protein SCB49_06657 [unidentified eubacterium SCB49]|nr:hypothetical protein SCB49_06657 [unidentified eubacterium SCB49]
METPPPPVVWENIQEALGHEKEDRKVIPIWWKLGGIAAALVLLFAVANLVMTPTLDNGVNSDNHLVIEDQPEASQKTIEQKNNESSSQKNEGNTIVSETLEYEKTSVASEDVKEIEDKVLQTNSSTPKASKQTFHKRNVSKTTLVANTTEKQDATSSKTEVLNNSSEKVKTSTAVAVTDVKSQNNNSVLNKEDIVSKELNNSTAVDAKVTVASVDEVLVNKDLEPSPTPPGKGESIFDAIEEQKEAVAKTTEELPADRWAISPNVAPVYYNTLSQGSSIDPSFSDNTQNGEVNMSYGINVSYALSPRLTVRSGVSNVNLSYATGDLELATGDASAALQSVVFNDNGTVITAVDQGSLINAPEGSPYGNLTRKVIDGDVFLTQSISYTEIPAELTYALVNKKFALNLIGGFSTLLLGNNEVAVSANNFKDVLGEANNLSDVSFSTNVGLGLSYQLSKRFKFNVEPMFKYQLNPYTDTSVDFKPYYVGVYSGLSFKF